MLNPQEIKLELYDNYIDEDGLVAIDFKPTKWSTGNGLMHLGLMSTMFRALNLMSYSDRLYIDDTLTKCKVSPGLYNRNPGRPDQIGHDDMTGVVSASVSADLSHHKEVAELGIKKCFIYNNDGDLQYQDFLGRMVFHAAYWLLCSYKLLFLLPLVLFKVILKADSYTRQHNYMFVENLNLKYRFLKPFRNYIVKRLGLQEECARYYGSNHPLTSLAYYVENTKL